MAILDSNNAAHPDGDGAPVPLSPAGERRRRAQELLAAQRAQLDHLETELPEELQRLAETIARDLAQDQIEELAKSHPADAPGDVAELRSQVDQLRQQLAARQSDLDRAIAQFDEARHEGGRLEQELRVCQSLLEAQMTAARERQ